MPADQHVLTELVTYRGRNFRIKSGTDTERPEILSTVEIGDVVLLSKTASYDPDLPSDAIERMLKMEGQALRERLLGGQLDGWLTSAPAGKPPTLPPPIPRDAAPGKPPTIPPPVPIDAAAKPNVKTPVPKSAEPTSVPSVPPTRRSKPGRWAVKVGRIESPFHSEELKSRPVPIDPPQPARTPSPEAAADKDWDLPAPRTEPTTAVMPVRPGRVSDAAAPSDAALGSVPPPTFIKGDRAGEARTIGPYRLVEELGPDRFVAFGGGGGAERIVTLRLFQKPTPRMVEEARGLQRIEHAALIPTIEVGQIADELFCAAPLLDGRDLRSVMMRCAETGKPIPVDIAAWVVREASRGLEILHSASRTHGSVTIENLILSYGGEARLGGLSDGLGRDPRATIADDLDALGRLLLELLGRGEDSKLSVRAPFVPPALLQVASRASGGPGVREPFRAAAAVTSALSSALLRDAPRTDASRLARFLSDLFPSGPQEDEARRDLLFSRGRSLTPIMEQKSPSQHPRPFDHDNVHELELAPGTIVDDRYCVRRLCGRGGMGWVYEAEHQGIGRRVAIKILHPIYSRAHDVAERFRREARAASKIGHPHIIDVFDFGTTDDGCLYIAMEFLEGRDLGALLEEVGQLMPDRALNISVQICRALEAAHAVGIVHRDLKPENIFLMDRGHEDFVKVLDFGIAKHIQDPSQEKLTRPNIALGTPEYMAPEQVAGKTDPRSDIYSVGAMLYEMLVGVPPFEGEHYLEVFRRKAVEEPPSPRAVRPELSPEIDLLVRRTLARDPGERQQTMVDLAKEMTALLEP